ncbi:ABC transporter permease [Virgibacillus alimentarius]|uniref:ABC-2 type transport system permease protein n=1 Tax=Virgibacillus alimentarius TaxID=698769 RepID=A0ABS4S6D9_9BACI|nr:ABC transporter permease [Virgibacillus alimentarius]MBP2257033.1 ABC-2 type transport system permease protein [Virgibacillus alimentarius]
MHLQRIHAIFEKDMKDFMKNTMMLLMPIVPIILAFFYRQMGLGEEMPVMMGYIIVGVTYSAVTANCIMAMMAEENEKKTLRGLIMSPASFLDVIIGKSLVTGFMTLITLVLSLLILGIDSFLNTRAILGLVLLFLFFLFLGIGVGLFAKSISTVSVYVMPIMFLFGFTPMIELMGLSEDNLVKKILDLFPISQLIEMHDSASWLPLGMVGIWVVAAALFMYVCFIKTRQDD